MKNCVLRQDTTPRIFVITKPEYLAFYGEKTFDKVGQEIPQDLLDRYRQNFVEGIKIRKELEAYYTGIEENYHAKGGK